MTNDIKLSFSLPDCSFQLSLFTSLSNARLSLYLPHFLSLLFFFQNLCLNAHSQYLSCSVMELSVILSMVKLKILTSSMIKILFFNARNTFLNLSSSY